MNELVNSPVVPAVIPQSCEELTRVLKDVSFVNEVQIDVVDGVFVPFSSWPYQPAGTPKEVAPYLKQFTIEIDLMVTDPVSAALAWQEAGAEMYVFHIETLSTAALETVVQKLKGSIGVCANNDTPLETLMDYIPLCDYVQLMGIREIGSQGQPFDESVLARIKAITAAHPALPISIDGSVNVETIRKLQEAGADRFVSGSAILAAETPQAGYEALLAAIA